MAPEAFSASASQHQFSIWTFFIVTYPSLNVFRFNLRCSHNWWCTWILSNPPLTLSQMSQSCFPRTTEVFQLIISLHYPPSAPSHPPPTLITVNKKPDLFLFHAVIHRSQHSFGHLTSLFLFLLTLWFRDYKTDPMKNRHVLSSFINMGHEFSTSTDTAEEP